MTDITPRSLQLFLDLADDAGNWSGMPLLGGNVGGSKADRGNITQLKQAGLIKTSTDEGDTFVVFTKAGAALAEQHGIDPQYLYVV